MPDTINMPERPRHQGKNLYREEAWLIYKVEGESHMFVSEEYYEPDAAKMVKLSEKYRCHPNCFHAVKSFYYTT